MTESRVSPSRTCAAGGVLMIVSRLSGLILPYLSKLLIDDVVGHGKTELLPMLAWGAVAATVLSVAMLARYSPKILETDLTKLRNKQSMESGSGYLSRYVDEIFQRYLSPLVALPRNRDDALKIADRLKALQAAQGKDSLIALQLLLNTTAGLVDTGQAVGQTATPALKPEL